MAEDTAPGATRPTPPEERLVLAGPAGAEPGTDADSTLEQIRLGSLRRCGLLGTILWTEQTGSTNDLALLLGRQGDVALPALVICERQTRGRGRGSNRWWSTSGALTFSLLLSGTPLGLQPENWSRISLATGVAICRVVDTLAPVQLRPCRLRWPNDVYLADRKLAGILVEGVLPAGEATASTRGRCVVVGIGINVNNSLDAAPSDVRSRAVALRDVIGYELDLTGLLLNILEEFFRLLRELPHEDSEVVREWQERCDLVGRWVKLTTPQGIVRGLCCGISPTGKLMLRTHRGQVTVTTGWDLAPTNQD